MMPLDKSHIPLISTIVGKKLRELREGNSVSQEALSAHLGISRPTLIAYETGKQSISIAETYLAADRFQVDMSALMPSLDQIKKLTSLDSAIAEKGIDGEELKDIESFISQIIRGEK
ncbi:MAG: helix-turn-helix transcriptional regulator [Deltaproteobacteria bacterium]|nr:MAG: helix-turn-helix transcriptional regulator [Deltaproteobacteria bacterium]